LIGISEGGFATGAVVRIALAGGALRGASSTLVHGSLIEPIGTVECTNSTDHDVRTLVIASSVKENLSIRTSGTSCVASEAFLAVVGAVLTGSIDGVSSNRADIQTFEVEEISAA